MAKGPAPVNPETAFACTLSVPNKYLPQIQGSVEGDAPMPEKVAFVAEGALLDLCEGGLVLNSRIVAKLAEAIGHRPSAEEVIEYFSKGAGRVNGAMQVMISLPPEYEGVVAQAAEFQGVSKEEILNNSWNWMWDNGDLYDPRPFVERLIMRVADKEAIKKLLGRDFTTGTELAQAVNKYIAERESPFAEVEK